ncbi:RluA family pseudouridine synthase [Brassicibacter mesophilus]|uniref:RluA family pseudouridine synthase n=1 Tax=Brassicibacter mesophilus TaxID=745119 RepID=UPI003D1A0DF6
MKPNIIFEDKNILVVEKPPMVPCQSDKSKDEDLINILINHLKGKNVHLVEPYLGLVHRLDRPVGGAMVFAKTKESNSNLSKQISERRFNKQYLTIVCGKPETISGSLNDFLKKLVTVNMSKVVSKESKGAKEAVLDYQVLDSIQTEEYDDLSLLKINLKTGRHHQIRVQLSNAGWPIWGDNKYNKVFVKKKEWTQISLWSYKLAFNHPVKKTQLSFTSLPSNEYPWNLFDAKLLSSL